MLCRRALPETGATRLGGQLRRFVHDPLALFTEALGERPDLVGFRLGPRAIATNVLLVNRPDMVRDVLQRSSGLVKSIGYRRMRELLGAGLLTSEGKEWEGPRKALEEHFSPSLINASRQTVEELVRTCLDSLNQDGSQVVNVSRLLSGLTLQLAAAILFEGRLLEDEIEYIQQALPQVQRNIVSRALLPLDWLRYSPFPSQRRHRTRVGGVRAIADRIIAEFDNTAPRRCLLKSLIQMRDAGKLSPTRLTDHVTTFLLTGHETTANALAWTIHLLSHNPGYQDVFRNTQTPRRNDLKTAIVCEGMRLYPPAWLMDREVTKEMTIGAIARVPPGTVIAVSPYFLHRDPGVWGNDANRFRPERFLEGRMRPMWVLSDPLFIPFGIGPRLCIGAAFAMLEMEVILQEICGRFQLAPTSQPVIPEPDITLCMVDELKIRVFPLEASRTHS